jgi:hypothetical protein
MVLKSEGPFDQNNLTRILQNFVAQETAGQLILTNQAEKAIIYFGIGRILAALCEPQMGVSVIRMAFSWTGHYEFYAQHILLSSLPRTTWINQSLPQLLQEINQTETSKPTLVPAASATGKPLPNEFITELEQLLKQLVGPFGMVLLEDAAENIGTEIDLVTTTNLTSWINALKSIVPAEQKQNLEQALNVMLRKHFK